MNGRTPSTFSAAPSATGYLFQCRYALLESLRRLRKNENFAVSVETLDDVVFEKSGEAVDLLQTKHHVASTADLTDASPDIWKTFRAWCEHLENGSIPEDSTFFLITTSCAPEGSAAYYLRIGESRDVVKAIERLNATAESSTNKTNTRAYKVFRNLSAEKKRNFLEAVIVLDNAPGISDLDGLLKEELFHAVDPRFLDSFVSRIEGWWFRRVINQLVRNTSEPILSEELLAEEGRLREQFKQDNLPVDDDIMNAAVDASGYQDRTFVHQLLLIEIGNQRIFYAIRNYFRAFEQRSRWVREDLLFVGELDRYEDRLVEEWELLFESMRDELGDGAAEEAKKKAARTLYKWVETSSHRSIRAGVTEPCIARGTYQILADKLRVGWHPEFLKRLKKLLEPQEA
ncbi:ABC-three component system protein [Thermostilla marina]